MFAHCDRAAALASDPTPSRNAGAAMASAADAAASAAGRPGSLRGDRVQRTSVGARPDPRRRTLLSESEDISNWKDPADSTERRDWDVPATAPGEPSTAGTDDAATFGDRDRPGDKDLSDAGEASRPPSEPADESERRDWDMP
jgi:hypothetical protein